MNNTLDKVKHTLSPTIRRRVSDKGSSTDNTDNLSREYQHSFIGSMSRKTHRRDLFRRHKSVSFAENTIQYENDTTRNQLSSRIDQIKPASNISTNDYDRSTTSINEISINDMNQIDMPSNSENIDQDSECSFYQCIRPRRMSIGNSKELIYQDLSAEIVAYVLKHALRAVEQEENDLRLVKCQHIMNKNEHGEDFLALK